MEIIIDNIIKRAVDDGEIVNNLILSGGKTRHGIKFRLTRVLTELDSTYNFNEVIEMTKFYNAKIRIWKGGFTNDQWTKLISSLKNQQNVTILNKNSKS